MSGCVVCQQLTELQCAGCATRYCSAACQKNAWRGGTVPSADALTASLKRDQSLNPLSIR